MRKTLAQGFTLIELLIVIAVLGILAVAVLSAINPIEQINRAKDTGLRSDAEQLIGAIDRYYASKGWYPWNTDANDATTPLSTFTKIASATVPVTSGQAVLNNLSVGGTAELKASFVTKVVGGQKALWLYNEGTAGTSTYACWLPYSSSFRDEAWKRCKVALPGDFPDAACPADATCKTAATSDAATGCFSCLP